MFDSHHLKQHRSGRTRLNIAVVAAAMAVAPAAALAELTDKNVHLPPAPPTLPAAGQTFVDPTFGSTILRLTGPADGNDNINVYSYWPTFNRSSTRLFIGTNGGGTLYDFNPTTMQASNKRNLFGKNAPDGSVPRWDDSFWSGSDPNILYGHSNLKLWAYNVNTTNYTLIKDFSSELPAGHLFQMYKSADDQVFTFTKQNENYTHTGNFAWRRDVNQIVYSVNDPANTNELQVDKSGRYVMVSHNGQGENVIQTTIRDLQTNTSTPLEDDGPDWAPGHGDLGHGFSVAADNWNNRLTGRSLADPHNPYTVINWSDWSQGDHTSMQADDQTWALTSMFYLNPSNHPSTGLFRDEILLVKTDGSQQVRRLAHHQSDVDGEPNNNEVYWSMPKANISFDGKYVAFTSNWGDINRRDVFILRVGVAPAALWNVNASGNWHTSSNWTSGSAPNAIGAEAELSSVISASRTVYADTPLTLGTLRFKDDNTYNLSGAASLTLQVNSGSALIDVQQGSHKLNLPLIVASNAAVNVAAGAALTIADPVTVNAGKTLTHTGTAATYASIVTLQPGAAILFSGMPAIDAVTSDAGARAQVMSSDSKILSVSNEDPDGFTALGTLRMDDAAFVVKSTFFGDTDLTGIVDVGDFGRFLGGYEEGAESIWFNGDFDYSGVVDLDDFNLFLDGVRGQGYLTPNLMPALREFLDSNQLDIDLSTVPEPTVLPLVAMAAMALRRRR
jgi:hypothetical protein